MTRRPKTIQKAAARFLLLNAYRYQGKNKVVFIISTVSRSVLAEFVYLAVTKFPYLPQFTVNPFNLGQYFVMKFEFRPLMCKKKGCGLHVADR